MEARVSKGGRIALPEPDLSPYEVVAEEKTPWWAPFGRNYVVVTVFLLVVMVLGYGGIVYGGASQVILCLTEKGGYGAGFIFAMTAWAGVVATAIYILNAFVGERLERRWISSSALSCSPPAISSSATGCTTARPCTSAPFLRVGVVLWLWSMYVYIPQNYPTRMRALGTGWTDGVGHLGAWGGVLIAGQLYA